RDRPVAKTRTARAASMPFPAARARPGAGAATPAVATTSTRTSRKRSDASAVASITRPTYRQGVPNTADPLSGQLARLGGEGLLDDGALAGQPTRPGVIGFLADEPQGGLVEDPLVLVDLLGRLARPHDADPGPASHVGRVRDEGRARQRGRQPVQR